MDADVIVIGAGTSGMMAALTAASQNKKVALLEKGPRVGRKLSITGGGRCNVTNQKPADELIKYIPGNGRFLFSAFSNFASSEIIAFFEKAGVKLKEEDHGRMFPVSNNAQSVVDALMEQLSKKKVNVLLSSPVQEILYKDNQVTGVKLASGKTLASQSVIVATGGVTMPKTGSSGDGYVWAKSAGHSIVDLYPTEVPLVSREPFIKKGDLQGLSLRDIKLSVVNPKGKVMASHEMDMIFTHFGVSGPAVLRCSQFVLAVKKKFGVNEVELVLDSFPAISTGELTETIQKLAKNQGKKALKNSLKGLVQERFLHFVFERNQISPDLEGSQLSNEQLSSIVADLKHFSFNVTGTLPMDKAFITGGGVHLKEINPKTMESKLMNGLYFCGEVLDIHGYTGGYNITAAFSTGHLAGMSAAGQA